MNEIIVSRHKAAIEFIREEIPESVSWPVVESITDEMAVDKIIYGNVPLWIAAMAERVIVVEFSGSPPRGLEYGLAEMRAAGARLSAYVVSAAF